MRVGANANNDGSSEKKSLLTKCIERAAPPPVRRSRDYKPSCPYAVEQISSGGRGGRCVGGPLVRPGWLCTTSVLAAMSSVLLLVRVSNLCSEVSIFPEKEGAQCVLVGPPIPQSWLCTPRSRELRLRAVSSV